MNWINSHASVCDELTNVRAGRSSPLVIGWRVRACSHRRRQTVPTVMHYCLPLPSGQFVENWTTSVQFSYVALYALQKLGPSCHWHLPFNKIFKYYNTHTHMRSMTHKITELFIHAQRILHDLVHIYTSNSASQQNGQCFLTVTRFYYDSHSV